ncbi:hypothetical protein [Pseudogulbenkiania sp. MAI-1]|uniref:hypothetical protein n=1 Tax=Pseudogulbenkiania sp. MAI-1 TaxID=990370 RepID=UPI00045EBCE0|nr:hypothetical protein [Pseudogulbenkiania sp. MAI-1]
MADTELETPRRPRLAALTRDRCKLNESVNNCWRAVVPNNITREQLILSDLWSVVSQFFNAYDTIRVVDEGRRFYAELLVLNCGRGYAEIIELSFHELPAMLTSQEGLPPNFSIDYMGPEKQYQIKRLSDGVIFRDGFASKADAVAYLLSHNAVQG